MPGRCTDKTPCARGDAGLPRTRVLPGAKGLGVHIEHVSRSLSSIPQERSQHHHKRLVSGPGSWRLHRARKQSKVPRRTGAGRTAEAHLKEHAVMKLERCQQENRQQGPCTGTSEVTKSTLT